MNIASYSNTLSRSYAIRVVSGMIALALSAHIAIPIQPVPLTFQTVVVMVIGMMYTPKEALHSTALYLALGILGLPIFKCGASGFAYFTGATGGYLVGFAVAATFIAYYKQYVQNSYRNLLLLLTAGHTIIYILGVSWLSTFVGSNAIYVGFLLFLPTGIAKTIALSSALHYLNIVKR